jgi:hypothetical protein
MLTLSALALAAHSTPAQVRIEQPDLVVEGSQIAFHPLRPAVGETMRFDISVRNAGRGGAAAKILCELVANDRLENRVVESREFDAQIGGNRTHTIQWSVRRPQGRQVYIAVSARVVGSGPPDSNESNNRASVWVYEGARQGSDSPSSRPGVIIERPDLVVEESGIAFHPLRLVPGEDVNFDIAVRNIGRGAAHMRIVCELIVEDRTERRSGGRREFEAQIGGNRTHTARWRVRMPQGRRVYVNVSAEVTGSGPPDSNPANNSASVRIFDMTRPSR